MDQFLPFLILLAAVWAMLNPQKAKAFADKYLEDHELNQAENPHAPKMGSNIELTWLPNKRDKDVANCYIGSRGKVEDLKHDGSFCLNMGGSVLVVGRRYKFKYID